MEEEKEKEKAKALESHLSSAVAFVEGGVQDACDDSCSICLEPFCESDPSTVTGCKHEFHLQCILEWCQRSSQCPMCWRPIVLKDPTSQELLEAVERERSLRSNQPRSTAIFHHPALGEFELQHLPVGASDSDLEERIIQHLAAAAAMGRTHHFARREGRGRSGGHGRPQFLVFSTHPNATTVGSVSSSQIGGENEPAPATTSVSSSVPVASVGERGLDQVPHTNLVQADQIATLSSATSVTAVNRPGPLNTRSAGQATPVSQDGAGPSDFQSFSESFKTRLNSVSMRYKESITKSARGWKEKLFSRNSSVSDIGSEVRREVNAGIASVSRMMERLDTRESSRATGPSGPHNSEGFPTEEPSSEQTAEHQTNTIPTNSSASASCGTTSALN